MDNNDPTKNENIDIKADDRDVPLIKEKEEQLENISHNSNIEMREVPVTTENKELKEYNTNMLIINSYWLAFISKISFSISLIIFEIILLVIVPKLLDLLQGKFVDLKEALYTIIRIIGLKWLFFFNICQHLSIGFFCLSNFSIILNEKDKPKKFLISNIIKCIIFYLLSVFILRYMIRYLIFDTIIEKVNQLNIISLGGKDTDKVIQIVRGLETIVIRFFSNLLGNFNNYLDRILIGSLYLIFFSTPKWLEEKDKLYFRLLSIIPIVYIIVSFIFRILYNLEIINLSEFVSPIFVGPKLVVFGFFIAFLLYVKYNEKKYKIFDENKNMIPIVFAKISTKIFGIFGLIELIIGLFFSSLSVYGIGNNYFFFLCAPIMLLYDYKKKFEIYIKPCKKENLSTYIDWSVPIILNLIVFVLGIIMSYILKTIFFYKQNIETFVSIVSEYYEYIKEIFDALYY